MELDVVVDDVFAEEAEEFARAVVAAEFGAVELEHAMAGDVPGIRGGDEQGVEDLTVFRLRVQRCGGEDRRPHESGRCRGAGRALAGPRK